MRGSCPMMWCFTRSTESPPPPRRALPVRRSGPADRHPAGQIPTATARRTSPDSAQVLHHQHWIHVVHDHHGLIDSLPAMAAARRPGASPRGRPLFRRGARGWRDKRRRVRCRPIGANGCPNRCRARPRAGPAPRRVHHGASGEARFWKSSSSSLIEVAARLRDLCKLAFSMASDRRHRQPPPPTRPHPCRAPGTAGPGADCGEK